MPAAAADAPGGTTRVDRTICRHFGLREAPFTIAPDPRFLFMSEPHREALAHLLHGVESGGIVVLTGEVGTGKTTVLRALLEQLPEACDVAFIVNPRLSETDFLAAICDEFGIAYPATGATDKVLVDAINGFLLDRHAAGRTCVLVVDEAQTLSVGVLEQMRLLTNLETSRCKLLHMVIIGQPELRATLAQPGLRQLSQRVTARYHLEALSRPDLAHYVRHRLKVAGGDACVFEAAALRRLHRLSGGIPRLINVICERAMLGTAVEGARVVSVRILDRAAREVLGTSGSASLGGRRAAVLAAVLLATVGLGVAATMGQLPILGLGEPVVASAPPEATPVAAGSGAGTEPPVADPIPDAPASAAPTVQASAVATPAAVAVDPPAVPMAMAVTPQDTGAPDSMVAVHRGTPPAGVRDAPFRVGRRDTALAALFAAWHVPPAAAGIDPCDHAERFGLVCLDATGGLTGLLEMNRPALLELIDDGGGIGYGMLETWNADGAAVVVVDGRPMTLTLGQLDDVWSGSFTVLWQPPIGYRAPLAIGDRGPVVAWLRAALARLRTAAGGVAPDGAFDEDLRDAVVAFQLARGLTPDGIAGPLTLLHLDSALTEPPRLMR